MENVVVVLPNQVVEEGSEFDTTKNVKGNGISISIQKTSFVGIRQTIYLGIVLSVFSIVFIAEGINYNGSNKSSELEDILIKYPMLESEYKRKAISSKYKTIDKLERKKRDLIKSVSKVFERGVVMQSLEMTEKRIKIVMTYQSQKRVEEVVFKLKKQEGIFGVTYDRKARTITVRESF